MADADILLMETSEQNGNEGDEDQNDDTAAEAELMADDEADGGKIDASKSEEDAGWVTFFFFLKKKNRLSVNLCILPQDGKKKMSHAIFLIPCILCHQ